MSISKSVICISLSLCLWLTSHTLSAQSQPKLNQEETKHMLVGQINQQGLQAGVYGQWFNKNLKEYKVKTKALNFDKSELKNIKVKIFMGTWCGDSKREVPRFFKIAQHAGITNQQIEMVAIKRNRQSPTHEEVGQGVHHVPTFIIYDKDKELGRIVENPVKSLEEDLINIVKQQGYTPDFAASEQLFALFKSKGNNYVQQNRKTIAKTLRSRVKNVWELLRVAYILSLEKKYKAAVTTCQIADQLYPKSLDVWLNTGKYYRLDKQLAMAKKYYKKVRKADTHNWSANYYLKKMKESK